MVYSLKPRKRLNSFPVDLIQSSLWLNHIRFLYFLSEESCKINFVYKKKYIDDSYNIRLQIMFPSCLRLILNIKNEILHLMLDGNFEKECTEILLISYQSLSFR